MKRHAFHRQAEQEYADAADYYVGIDPGWAAGSTMRTRDVRQQPGRFPLFDIPIRRHFSDLFPYVVLYVDQSDRVLILAVMHMKRRPGY